MKLFQALIRALFLCFLFFQNQGVGAQEVQIKIDDRLMTMSGTELVNLGLDYLRARNMPDSALLCFTIQANRRFVNPKDSTEQVACAEALNYLGVLYKAYFSDYQKAWGFYHLSEEYAVKHHQDHLLPKIHNNMAGLTLLSTLPDHQRMGHVTDSVLLRSMRTFEEAALLGQQELMGVIASNLAALGLNCHAVDKVGSVLRKFCSMKLSEEDNPTLVHARYLCKAVLASGEESSAEESIAFLDSALSCGYAKNHQERCNDSVINYLMRYAILFEKELYPKALATADSLICIASRNGHHIGLAGIYQDLSDYYKSEGKQQDADKYELLFHREKDIIVNQSNLRDIEKTKFLFEIDNLNQKAREQAHRERIKTYMMYGTAVVVVLLVCMLILVVRKYRQTQEKNRQLYLKNTDLLKAHEEEVRRWELAVADNVGKPKAKYEKNPMDENGKQDLMHRVFLVMEKSEDVFKPNFTLDRLAELVDANPTYVSYVINEKRQCNFNVLLNEYRIKEACRRMSDAEHYGHLSIEGIAASVGIKSRTNFSTNFKKYTGLTPSEYQRMARENSRKQD